MKGVAILGSTGSIGVQALDVISQHKDRLRVVGLTARRSEEKLLEQARAHGVSRLALAEGDSSGGVPRGMNAVCDVATAGDVDIVVVAVAGVIGLMPTLAAIRADKRIALASKEVLVAAGEIVMPLIREHGVALTPIDSEHSAIFQCLQGYSPSQVESVILTASGGPFRGFSRAELEHVSVEQALRHPTWRMGGKITIDSATLMNKGLETIEAKWLFGLEIEQVETVIHPQSVIHSMVRMKDGSVLGQLGWPDMRLPLSYALLWPERVENSLPRWDPLDTGDLRFEAVDHETFPSIQIARRAAAAGGTTPSAMNAANEEAANLFLEGSLGFLEIAETVQAAVAAHRVQEASLDNILAADAEARQFARQYKDRARRTTRL